MLQNTIELLLKCFIFNSCQVDLVIELHILTFNGMLVVEVVIRDAIVQSISIFKSLLKLTNFVLKVLGLQISFLISHRSVLLIGCNCVVEESLLLLHEL